MENSQSQILIQFQTQIQESPKNIIPKVPIIFLHGLLGQQEDWRKVWSALSSKLNAKTLPFSLTFIGLDLPGHGQSPLALDNLDQFQQVVDLFLDKILNLLHSPPLLVGYSMGGRLAQAMAIKSPELFRGLILLSSSPGIEDPQERSMRMNSDSELLKGVSAGAETMEDFLERWYRQDIFANLTDHPLFPKLMERRGQQKVESLNKILKVMSVGSMPSFWQAFEQLPLPTLYLSGRFDRKYSLIGEKLSGLSKRISHRQIEGAGHAVHLQEPQQVADIILEWLQNSKLFLPL